MGKWRQSSSLPNAVSSARLLGDDDFYLGLLAERNIPSQGVRSSPVQGHMKRRWRTLLPTTGNLLEPRNLNTSYEREAERCAKKGKLATTIPLLITYPPLGLWTGEFATSQIRSHLVQAWRKKYWRERNHLLTLWCWKLYASAGLSNYVEYKRYS